MLTMNSQPTTTVDFLGDTKLSLEEEERPVSFKSYVSHVRETMDPDLFLGFLCWYSVPGSCTSTYDDYKKLVEDTGAPIRLARPPKASNVFRRACTDSQKNHRKEASGNVDVFYNYTIRETGKDDQKLYRKMVREEIDHEGHELAFVELGDITFIRETGFIRAKGNLNVPYDPQFQEIVTEIRTYVQEHALTVTAYSIRESIRNALEGGHIHAVRVNPNGGVYFVNANKAEILSKIEHLCSELPGVTFELPPLLDDGKQRELLRTAFQEESVGALQLLSAEMIDLAQGDGDITEDRWVKLRMAYEDQRARVNEYSGLLNDALDESSASLEICDRQIMNLRKKVVS